VDGGVTAHQAMQALPVIANKAASALFDPLTEFALGQKHFITLDEGICPAKLYEVQYPYIQYVSSNSSNSSQPPVQSLANQSKASINAKCGALVSAPALFKLVPKLLQPLLSKLVRDVGQASAEVDTRSLSLSTVVINHDSRRSSIDR
jgi:hypothetical protein